jgi:hypothetical protein
MRIRFARKTHRDLIVILKLSEFLWLSARSGSFNARHQPLLGPQCDKHGFGLLVRKAPIVFILLIPDFQFLIHPPSRMFSLTDLHDF